VCIADQSGLAAEAEEEEEEDVAMSAWYVTRNPPRDAVDVY
jgi:hypothetical protein